MRFNPSMWSSTGRHLRSTARTPSGICVPWMRHPEGMRLLSRGRCALKAISLPAASPSALSKPAMPLSSLQTEILRLLASHRDPESFVGGSTPLNRNTLRYSGDIDVFHDREERVSAAAIADARTLEEAGYGVTWLRQLPSIYTAQIGMANESTRLEWVTDSDFRFFPAVKDEEGLFGYVLNPVDLAINKAMAAAGRREVRDIVDLVTTHETVLPLGAIVWAAVEKSPGFTPEGLLAEIRRNAHYSAAEWKALATLEPIDPVSVLARLRSALEDAET